MFPLAGVQSAHLEPLQGTLDVILTDSRFFSANVSDTTIYTNGERSRRMLVIRAWRKGYISGAEKQETIEALVRAALLYTENIDSFDGITIRAYMGFDIGISRGTVFFTETDTISGWRNRLNLPQNGRKEPTRESFKKQT